ncbi:MAG: hypothetical protein HZB68_01465 [Candidatus Aenigmarchaeota archaeon]|nr:hypothetical protein [Candidatus Aenigmarchaeota archaeon]
MELEKLYNSWLKKMGDYKYEPHTIGELLEYSMSEKPKEMDVIIEGVIIDRNERYDSKYNSIENRIDFLIEGIAKDVGNAVVAEASNSHPGIRNFSTASVSRIGDHVVMSGTYNPENMEVRIAIILNKTVLEARNKKPTDI